jgi:hypothetical protein
MLVVTLLVGFGILLLPAYAANYRFQRFLERAVQDPALLALPPDAIRIAVSQAAARLGVPLKPDQVRLRADNGLRIEARYFVRVDMPLYTVDLHFNPKAGH